MLSERRETSTPAAVVWARLIDVESWPSWTRSVTRIERLDSGPLRVGSRATVVQPHVRPSVWEVTDLQDQREFTWRSRQPGTTVIARHVLTARSDGTSVLLTLELRGPLTWLARMLAGRRLVRYLRMEADGLAGPE